MGNLNTIWYCVCIMQVHMCVGTLLSAEGADHDKFSTLYAQYIKFTT